MYLFECRQGDKGKTGFTCARASQVWDAWERELWSRSFCSPDDADQTRRGSRRDSGNPFVDSKERERTRRLCLEGERRRFSFSPMIFRATVLLWKEQLCRERLPREFSEKIRWDLKFFFVFWIWECSRELACKLSVLFIGDYNNALTLGFESVNDFLRIKNGNFWLQAEEGLLAERLLKLLAENSGWRQFLSKWRSTKPLHSPINAKHFSNVLKTFILKSNV